MSHASLAHASEFVGVLQIARATLNQDVLYCHEPVVLRTPVSALSMDVLELRRLSWTLTKSFIRTIFGDSQQRHSWTRPVDA